MSEDAKRCPYCGKIIKASEFICSGCGKQQPDVTLSGRKPRPIIG